MTEQLKLTDEQAAKLKQILDCADDVQIRRLKLALRYADNLEKLQTLGAAISVIGRYARNLIITTAALIVAIAAVNSALKTGLTTWLFGS